MSHARRIALLLFSSVAMVLRCIATTITADRATQATQAWIEANDTLDVPLNASVSNVVSHAVDMSGNLIHVVNLEGGGYVITSGDDQIEPILAFSDSGEWEFSGANPLWAILRRDASNRYETVERAQNSGRKLLSAASTSSDKVKLATARNKAKWEKLVAAQRSKQAKSGIRLMASGGKSSISDVRVSPLVKSTWNQSYVIKSGIFSDTKYLCYNYCTPKQYPCGCVATAMAQVMRYHKWPLSYVEPKTFSCSVDGIYTNLTIKGGYYDWDNMPLTPTYSSSDKARQAIGKLTYDAGVSVGMMYEESGSGAYMSDVAPALRNTFGYANAIHEYGPSFGEICANLDAGCPVLWGISGDSGGHAVGVDGYGYSTETFYVHVNMGWGGSSNAWYNPDDGITTSYPDVDDCVLDIFPSESNKVVISGRVLSEAGIPIEGATVECLSTDGTFVDYAYTNEKGIWFQFVPKSDWDSDCPLQIEAYWDGYRVESIWGAQSFYESRDKIDFVIPELSTAVDYVSSDGWNNLTFSTGSSFPWFRQTDNFISEGDAAQSATIGHSAESWMAATTSYEAGKLKFWWKVSSEQDCDKLHFSIDGEEVASISGTNGEWRCETFLVPKHLVFMENQYGGYYSSEDHIFKWTYTKDKAVVGGLDCGWVDKVTWQSGVSISFSAYDGSHQPSYYFYTNIVMYVGDDYGQVPSPQREGYALDGWFRTNRHWDSASGQSYYTTNWLSSSSIVTNTETSWTAAWKPNTYFVLFDANMENGGMVAQRHTYDLPQELMHNSFRRNGYEFRGWSSTPDGHVQFIDSSIVTNLTAQSYGAFILYAVWHPTTVTTEVPVPHDWLEKYGLVKNGDYEMAGNQSLGKTDSYNRPQPVWHDWLLGTDPTNLESRLTVQIDMKDELPLISWTPEAVDNRRKYIILGKKSLADENWEPVEQHMLPNFRFFKIEVEFTP